MENKVYKAFLYHYFIRYSQIIISSNFTAKGPEAQVKIIYLSLTIGIP